MRPVALTPTLHNFSFAKNETEKQLSQTMLFRVTVGFTLLYLSSQTCLLIGTIPITFQPLIAILLGFYYSPRDAASSVGSYLCLGALGLPIFSAHRFGISHLLGPTGGYLFGFFACAVVVSYLKERFNVQRWCGLLLLNCIGSLCIYSFGILWLTSRFMDLRQALQVGFLPFVLPAFVKAGFLTAIVSRYPPSCRAQCPDAFFKI